VKLQPKEIAVFFAKDNPGRNVADSSSVPRSPFRLTVAASADPEQAASIASDIAVLENIDFMVHLIS
jgi:hypothetical protein